MKKRLTTNEKRKQDPYLDRRLDEDRRESYIMDYFLNGGSERRDFKERRTPGDRRKGYVPITKWTSIRRPGRTSANH